MVMLEDGLQSEKYLWVILHDNDTNYTYVGDPEKMYFTLFYENYDNDINPLHAMLDNCEDSFLTSGFKNYLLVNGLEIPLNFENLIIIDKEYRPYMAAHGYLT